MSTKTMTFEDSIRIGDALFDQMFEITNAATDRKVRIVLDENCVRWHGYARGVEAQMMGVSDRKFIKCGYGWIPVRRRHEYIDEDRDKCISSALRFVNESVRSKG